jgi:amidohydrolase
VRPGPTSAASNPFTVTFRGKGTHGANPSGGTDAIVAACQAVVALQTISSRRTHPTDSIVITVGAFHAGTVGNIIPEIAEIKGIMRTLNPKTRARAKEDFKQVISGIAAAMNVEADIDMRDGYAASINDEAMTELMRGAAAKVLGAENVMTTPAPSLGTEDIGYFLEKAPGCYYSIGARTPDAEPWPLHNPRYTVDTDTLAYGAALYFQIAQDFLV